MKTVHCLILCFVPLLLYGQNKGELGFKFEFNSQFIDMSNVNSVLLDESLITLGDLNTPRIEVFSKGKSFSGSINFQFLKNWSFGLNSSLIIGNITHSDGFIIPIGENVGDTMQINRNYTASSISIGIDSRLSISNLFKFNEKKGMVNRLLFGLNLSTGYGFASFDVIELWFYNGQTTYENSRWQYKSNGLQSRVGLDLGVLVTKNNLISSIGFNIGYQFYKTDNLKDRSGDNFMTTGKNSNLDFSGLYFGGVLKLAR